MRIIDFEKFIREIPYKYQAFEVKREIWKNLSQPSIIDRIFDNKEKITLSRFDLFHSAWDLEGFIIKVLMWGYPTKGRGKNIDNLLLPENFDQLINKLKTYEGKGNITLLEVQTFLEIKGLGFSTLSKILYFKRLKIESYPALILDMKVINALNSGRFEDSGIEKFKDLNYNNAVFEYVEYLYFMNSLADQMNATADQVE